MFITPWMETGSLRDVLKKGKVENASHERSIEQGMARGLAYLHGRGVVHCDFKSLNVLLDDQMQPRIGDFGLAKLQGLLEQRIDSTTGYGTPLWEAPEQLRQRVMMTNDHEITFKADVYSFGLVLWELHNSPELPSLTPQDKFNGMLPEMPKGPIWADIVTRCCALKTSGRPTMEQVLHELRDADLQAERLGMRFVADMLAKQRLLARQLHSENTALKKKVAEQLARQLHSENTVGKQNSQPKPLQQGDRVMWKGRNAEIPRGSIGVIIEEPLPDYEWLKVRRIADRTMDDPPQNYLIWCPILVSHTRRRPAGSELLQPRRRIPR
ncbi:unnamed protein product [Polarella glacialis]|uniref:Protein kinase domain-containing protein n=1 Tax=Polarella glacialis TaxID=89957 RepID=A0A813EA02_POLGL|nr:unnamed protein product [Polarella glacialis]